MISKKLEQLLNEQVKNELYSAYLYLSMASYFESINLKGFANWYRVQVQEERDHALMFFDYMHKIGANVELLAIDQPETKFASPKEVFEKTLAHEELVTSLIYNIMTTAQEEHDYKTIQFLQWFVSEQTKEEDNARGLIEKLKLAGSTEGGLFLLDNELATRVYVAPTTTDN